MAYNTLKADNIVAENLVLQNYNNNSLQKLLGEVSKRLTVMDIKGQVIYDSKKFSSEEQMDDHSGRFEVVEAISGSSGFEIRKSSTLGDLRAYYAKAIETVDGKKYIVRSSTSFEEQKKELNRITIFGIIFFIGMNIFLCISYRSYLKSHLFNKIDEIRKALVSGDEVKTIYSKGDRWIIELWQVVKKWQEKNLENLKQLEIDKKRLQRIIGAVDMSVSLVDSDLKVIVRNEALNYLYYEGRSNLYYKDIKDLEVMDTIKRGIKERSSYKKEIYLLSLKKYLLIGVKYLEFSNEYLITIKDTTGNHELIEVQKKFISDISHELKTPLTNIKGYLIALEDTPGDMNDYFIGVAKKNVEKIEKIVYDFLSISKYENNKVVNLRQVSTSKIEKTLMESLDNLIKKKEAKITYKWKLDDEDEFIKVDVDKFNVILKNLVENGIVYNKNKPKIDILVEELYSKYRVVVVDNGMGIPLEDREKIFDRFYRVDEARTSNDAGTGLGLSIVRELVEILSGNIEITSAEEVGTKITFEVLK